MPVARCVPAFVILAILLAACQPVSTPAPTLAPTSPPPTATTPPQPSPTAAAAPTPTPHQTSTLVQLHMLNPNEGWAVDSLGNILHTTLGLRQWQNLSPRGAKPGVGPSRVTAFFLDSQHAWALYTPQDSPPLAPIQIWRTADGGSTWAAGETIEYAVDFLGPVALQFVDPQHGWFLGQIYPGMHQVYAVLYATSDGGATWQLVSDSTPMAKPSNSLPGSYSLPYGPETFTFVNDQLGFAGDDRLYKTQDGGRSWAPLDLPAPPDAPRLTQPSRFVSPPRFATPLDGVLQVAYYEYDNIYCPPCDIAMNLPAALYLYYTHDGGQTWTPYPAPALAGNAGLIDAQNGWFLGSSDLTMASTALYLTADGGQSWTLKSKDTFLPICAHLNFVSAQTAFADNPYNQGIGRFWVDLPNQEACARPYLYQSTDGGETWSELNISPLP